MGSFSRNNALPGTSWRPARGTVSSDSSWKEGGGEIRLGRRRLRTGAGNRASLASRAGLVGPLRSAEGGTGRKRNGYFFFFFFLMRALVTFEGRSRAGPRSGAESGFFSPRWRIVGRRRAGTWGDAVAWTRRLQHGEQRQRRRRGQRVSGEQEDLLPTPPPLSPRVVGDCRGEDRRFAPKVGSTRTGRGECVTAGRGRGRPPRPPGGAKRGALTGGAARPGLMGLAAPSLPGSPPEMGGRG